MYNKTTTIIGELLKNTPNHHKAQKTAIIGARLSARKRAERTLWYEYHTYC
jgi:hypothetical protein